MISDLSMSNLKRLYLKPSDRLWAGWADSSRYGSSSCLHGLRRDLPRYHSVPGYSGCVAFGSLLLRFSFSPFSLLVAIDGDTCWEQLRILPRLWGGYLLLWRLVPVPSSSSIPSSTTSPWQWCSPFPGKLKKNSKFEIRNSKFQPRAGWGSCSGSITIPDRQCPIRDRALREGGWRPVPVKLGNGKLA